MLPPPLPARERHSHCPGQRGRGNLPPFYKHHHFEVTKQSHHLMITSPYVILGFFRNKVVKKHVFSPFLNYYFKRITHN